MLSGDSCSSGLVFVFFLKCEVCLHNCTQFPVHSHAMITLSNIYLERCFRFAALVLLSANAFNNGRGGNETKNMSP